MLIVLLAFELMGEDAARGSALVFFLPHPFMLVYGYLGGKGQTPGQRLMRLRMVLPNGDPPGFWRAWLRCMLQTLSANCLFLGFLWMLWDRNQQTFHDNSVRIRVVRA
jgi:uncharacterized RDD family membrane protein YckC